MATPSQDDIERQFQADLERAAALSMETLALEEFKRKQRNSTSTSASSSSYRSSMNAEKLDFSRTESSSVQYQQHQQRRRSEHFHSSSTAPDLISFSGPDPNPVDLTSNSSGTSPTGDIQRSAAPVDKHTSFVQYVDQIHQLSAQQYSARMSSSNALTHFIRTPIPIAGPAGMQLMPYQPSPPVAQTQPLTPDNLQKLYNSPYYPGSGYSRFPSHQLQQQPHPSTLQHQFRQQQPAAVASFPTQMRSASVPPLSATGDLSFPWINLHIGGEFEIPFYLETATHGAPVYGTTSQYQSGIGFVNNPESALVPVPKPVPTLTPITSTPISTTTTNGGSSSYTVAPRARKPSEKVADDNLIDLDGLGQSLDK